MQTKPDKSTHSPHGGSIPLTRYAREKPESVAKNVAKRRPFRRVWSRHAETVGLNIIRRVKWAVFPPRMTLPFFFALALIYPAQAKPVQRHQSSYARAVNVTLDTVMWVHEQHRGKMTWSELNAEVCRQMKVRRTDPWQRR